MASGLRDPEVGSVQPTPYRLCACDQGPRADQQDQSLERPLWLRLSVKCRKFPDIYGYWGCWLGSGCGILLPYTGQVPFKQWLVCSPGGGSPEETRPVSVTKGQRRKSLYRAVCSNYYVWSHIISLPSKGLMRRLRARSSPAALRVRSALCLLQRQRPVGRLREQLVGWWQSHTSGP